MCLSTAYLEREGRKEVVMEEVARVSLSGDEVVLEDLFGKSIRTGAKLSEVDLMEHILVLEEPHELPEALRRAKEFHGHLGPVVTLGLRMGRVISEKMGNEPFSYMITAFTGPKPPPSCLVDGLQLSTPCTVGNGGIRIEDGGELRAVAEMKGRRLEVSVREEIRDKIAKEYDPEREEVLPLELWAMSDEELFNLEESFSV
ncbi:MAG TPA: CooT family nickel-binding protein [Candidatus Latescibacteria bacterium]|nr:CooT family nickel-binding protein [Candidatus Latescibacterota bacterium]